MSGIGYYRCTDTYISPLEDSEQIERFYRILDKQRREKEEVRERQRARANPQATYQGVNSIGTPLIKYGSGDPLPARSLNNTTPRLRHAVHGGFGAFAVKPRFVPGDVEEFFPVDELDDFPWIGITHTNVDAAYQDLKTIPTIGLNIGGAGAIQYQVDKFVYLGPREPEDPHYTSYYNPTTFQLELYESLEPGGSESLLFSHSFLGDATYTGGTGWIGSEGYRGLHEQSDVIGPQTISRGSTQEELDLALGLAGVRLQGQDRVTFGIDSAIPVGPYSFAPGYSFSSDQGSPDFPPTPNYIPPGFEDAGVASNLSPWVFTNFYRGGDACDISNFGSLPHTARIGLKTYMEGGTRSSLELSTEVHLTGPKATIYSQKIIGKFKSTSQTLNGEIDQNSITLATSPPFDGGVFGFSRTPGPRGVSQTIREVSAFETHEVINLNLDLFPDYGRAYLFKAYDTVTEVASRLPLQIKAVEHPPYACSAPSATTGTITVTILDDSGVGPQPAGGNLYNSNHQLLTSIGFGYDLLTDVLGGNPFEDFLTVREASEAHEIHPWLGQDLSDDICWGVMESERDPPGAPPDFEWTIDNTAVVTYDTTAHSVTPPMFQAGVREFTIGPAFLPATLNPPVTIDQGNPYLFEANWSEAQWIIVNPADSSRYYCQYVSSSIPFSPEDEGSEAMVAIVGQTLTLSILSVEPISWDSVAGDISKMTSGKVCLYAANSFQTGHLTPERTQLIQHGGTMEGAAMTLPPDDDEGEY